MSYRTPSRKSASCEYGERTASYSIQEIRPGYVTFNTTGCLNCETKDEFVGELRNALAETIEQNEVLRTRVVELEAWVNRSCDKIDKKERAIKELRTRIWKANKPNESQTEG